MRKISIAISIIFLSIPTVMVYSNQYRQDSLNTATKGIIFKETLKLDVYKNVATGNDLFGSYNKYSRSDRQSEVATVYCGEYCDIKTK